jgi:polysaccharide biosynthesis transport protein
MSIVRAIYKRKLWVAGTWLAVAAIAFLIVRRLPTVYKSETLIQVETQRIPERFVEATVNVDLRDRVVALSQQILTFRRLTEIIKKLDLYREERERLVEEELVELMRRDITVQIDEGRKQQRGESPHSFRVAYQGPKPTVVALVANQLSNLFIDENLRAREVQAVGTSEFLDNQLSEAKKRLEEQEGKLSEYKVAHNGELPQQENTLIAQLARLDVQLRGVQESLARAEQAKMLAAQSIASAEGSAEAMKSLFEQVTATVRVAADGSTVPDSAALEMKLNALRSIYTEQHPDVVATRATLARARRAEAEASRASKTHESTQTANRTATQPQDPKVAQLSEALIRERERINNLKSQQDLAISQIAALHAQQTQISHDIQTAQSRVDNLPLREQQITSVTRDYEISKNHYQSLLDKKLAAEMAADMERRQKAERFTIIETARIPEKPIRPNRRALFLGACAAGLFLAMFVAAAVELRNNTLLGEWELPPGIPVLARVPHIGSTQVNTATRLPSMPWRRVAVVTSVVLGLAVITAGIVSSQRFELPLPGAIAVNTEVK